MLGLILGLNLGSAATRSGRQWRPQDLAGDLLAFWSADDTALITESSGLVSSWKDRVNAYDLTASLTARPLFAATSWSANLPSVAFDGTANCLVLAPSPFPAGTVPSEIWALVDQSALPADGSGRALFGYGAASNAARTLLRIVNSSVNRLQVLSGNGTTGLTSNELTHDFSGQHVVRGAFAPSDVTSSIDGFAGPVTASVASTATTRVRMGAGSNTTAGNFFYGKIRKVLVTNPLSQSDSTRMLAYLGKDISDFAGGGL